MKTWLLYIEACDPHHFLAGWQVARGEISIVPGARNTLIIIYLGCERKREKAVGGAAAKESDSSHLEHRTLFAFSSRRRFN
jgi:hypothetical protein